MLDDDFSLRRESRSLDDDELDLRLRFGGDFLDRFRRLLSDDDDDDELVSLRDLDLERDLDRERDRERDRSRRLERFELIDLLLLLFFLRRPNSSYSESEDSRFLYSTTSRSL